jgi:hypothetical protein
MLARQWVMTIRPRMLLVYQFKIFPSFIKLLLCDFCLFQQFISIDFFLFQNKVHLYKLRLALYLL